MPSISCGVVGVSSGGHPGMEVVVPDAPVEPSLGPPGPAIAPIAGTMPGSLPLSQIIGITGGRGRWYIPKHLSTPKGRSSGGSLSDACLPTAPVPMQGGDGAMTPQLPQGKGGAGSTTSRWEDIGAPWAFTLQ